MQHETFLIPLALTALLGQVSTHTLGGAILNSKFLDIFECPKRHASWRPATPWICLWIPICVFSGHYLTSGRTALLATLLCKSHSWAQTDKEEGEVYWEKEQSKASTISMLPGGRRREVTRYCWNVKVIYIFQTLNPY